MTKETIHLTTDHIGQRVDAALAGLVANTSRAQVQAWIKNGLVTDQDGKVVTQASLKIKQPVTLVLHRPDIIPFAPPKPEERSALLDIVYEDEHLLVINKPVGLTVHPGAGNRSGTLVNLLLAHTHGRLSDSGDQERPGIVHRLDKDTSGLMMVAKTNHVHNVLSAALQRRDITRIYQALVWGLPSQLAGTIDAPLGRDPKNRQRRAITGSGKHAVTHYRVEQAFQTHFSLIACRLETGRTHQIRVHLTSIGHPLVGDKTYIGRTPRRIKNLPDHVAERINGLRGQALHASELRFVHPVTEEEMIFNAPLPAAFQALLDDLAALF